MHLNFSVFITSYKKGVTRFMKKFYTENVGKEYKGITIVVATVIIAVAIIWIILR